MINKKEKGFTLVELLAVIVILAIILVIAVPKVMLVIEDSKKATLESTAKMIASAAEKTKVQNTVLGNNVKITCDSVAKINKGDYANCSIEFDNNTAKVTIEGDGKFDGLNVCGGTKAEAKVSKDDCPQKMVDYIEELFRNEENLNNGLIKDNTDDENIRYAGATDDVKNKVYFNCSPTDGINEYGSKNYKYNESCEIWRIIGVFSTYLSESDTIGAKRIKIVRDDPIGLVQWDVQDNGIEAVNQWGETTLTSDNITVYPGAYIMQYLNGDKGYRLSAIAKEQIDEVVWYTGAVSDGTKEEMYKMERGDVGGGSTKVNYTSKWLGKIGLIYPSDFGYAGINCGNISVSKYEESCGLSSNWLSAIGLNNNYSTISPYASLSQRVWGVKNDGGLVIAYVDVNPYAKPSVYLKPGIKVISGNGNTEPYILKLD